MEKQNSFYLDKFVGKVDVKVKKVDVKVKKIFQSKCSDEFIRLPSWISWKIFRKL